MVGPIERYKKLGLAESLPRIYLYPTACKELSFILRGAYSGLPKNLQTLIFQDSLTAFRLLPGMQPQNAVLAANLLLQSAEAVLPKQKKVLAIKEFKQAKVAHKRRCKSRQEEGSVQLPEDVLVHIFSFLDLWSLVSAGLWNLAASDNSLWHSQHVILFGNSNTCSRELQSSRLLENKEHTLLEEDGIGSASIDWREAFKKVFIGNSSKRFSSYRGYCGRCNSIVWLSNMKCSNKQCKLSSKNQQIQPVSPEQIVEYLLDETISTISSSDSDSDSDEGSFSKMWAYPRRSTGVTGSQPYP